MIFSEEDVHCYQMDIWESQNSWLKILNIISSLNTKMKRHIFAYSIFIRFLMFVSYTKLRNWLYFPRISFIHIHTQYNMHMRDQRWYKIDKRLIFLLHDYVCITHDFWKFLLFVWCLVWIMRVQIDLFSYSCLNI